MTLGWWKPGIGLQTEFWLGNLLENVLLEDRERDDIASVSTRGTCVMHGTSWP